MTLTAELTDYANRHADQPYLGKILWFSCRAAHIQHDRVLDVLTPLGLEAYAPYRPSDADAWRKAARTIAQNRIPSGRDDGVYYNILVRDLKTAGDDELLRRLVIEEVDVNGKRLDYHESYELRFHKPSASCDFRALESTPLTEATEAAQKVGLTYAQTRGCVDQNGIRNVLTRATSALKCVTVRETGGVLFCPRSTAEKLNALQSFADQMPGCDFHLLPLVDDDSQRSMVTKAVTDESLAEIDSVLVEMREILGTDGQVSAARFASINSQFKALTERADAYSDLLEDSLDTTKARLAIFGTVMAELSSRIAS